MTSLAVKVTNAHALICTLVQIIKLTINWNALSHNNLFFSRGVAARGFHRATLASIKGNLQVQHVGNQTHKKRTM